MIAIICNLYKNEVIKFTENFIAYLNEKNVEFKIWKDAKQYLNIVDDDHYCDIEQMCMDTKYIISIGGDGTFLFSSYFAVKYNKLIYGLNFGKLGYLSEPEPQNLSALIDKILNDDFTIDERILLECKINDSREYIAVNDVVIDKGGFNKTIELKLFANDNYVSTIIADGIIISTPTGSTAYSLACGGPVISPNANVFVLTPIAPHSLTIRPLVLTDNTQLKIEPYSRGEKLRISFDGQHDLNIESYDTITIRKSEKKLRIIQINQKPYFDLLRDKLLWGYDYRNKHS
jgi:NAD+ kinase